MEETIAEDAAEVVVAGGGSGSGVAGLGEAGSVGSSTADRRNTQEKPHGSRARRDGGDILNGWRRNKRTTTSLTVVLLAC